MSGEVIEMPRRTRLVFAGGVERVIPLGPEEMRGLLKQAGAQGALYITLPTIAGALDINLSTLCFFEPAFKDS